MPDPDRLLNTLRRAVQSCRETPGRCGRLVDLTGAGEVLVGGDLHGHLENFRALLKRADLGNHPARHLVLQEVVHGPHVYMEGGDKSHQLLDLTAALKCQFPNQVHLLPGNHELSQATGRPIFKGEASLNDLFADGVRAAYGDRAPEVYAAYLELIAALPLALRTANRVFISHSLPSARRMDEFDLAALKRDVSQEKDLLPGGSVFALVWGRDTSPENIEAFLRKVDADFLINGHIPSDKGYNTPNHRQLILDCMGLPAAYCLFPCDRPLTFEELAGCVQFL